MKAYYIYILKCSDDSYYIGSTNDLDRRICEHSQGIGGYYTKDRLPIKLVYCEEFQSKSEAFEAERKLKN